MSTDSNFERTFADLAYARLRDKAPSMLDYLIGFQLLDKNDDETRAVGVFGFKIGSEWVYAPVFFINGELKGHELLYVKGQDAFVPLTEEWVNYILNRRPPVLGESEYTPRNLLPIRQPDFDVFARAPYVGSKFAAAARASFNGIAERLHKAGSDEFSYTPFLPVFCPENWPNGQKYAALNVSMSLPGAMYKLGDQAVLTLTKSLRNDEKFANAVLRFYDIRDLVGYEAAAQRLAKQAGIAIKRAAEGDKKVVGTAPKVVVVTRGDDPSTVMKDMTDKEKEQLLRNQYVVRDSRDEAGTARLYKTQIQQQLQNPSSNGLYEIATSAGDRRNLLVITAPQSVGEPKSGCCVVIDPEKKQLGTFQTRDILISKRLEGGEWGKLFDSDAFQNPSSLQVDDVAVLVGPKGNGTVPFRVDRKWTDSEGHTEMKVWPHHMEGRRSGMNLYPRRESFPTVEDYTNDRIETLHLTGKDGNNLTQIGTTMFVPNGYKAIKVPKEFRYSMGGTLDLGTLSDVVLKLWKSAEDGRDIYRLQVRTDGISFVPVINGLHKQPLSKLAMLKHLIMDHALSQGDAEYILKEAKPRKVQDYLVKRAYSQPGPGYFPEPVLGTAQGINVPIQYSQTELQNVGRIDNQHNRQIYRDDRYIDEGAKRYATEAASAGQKEILDTAVISGLVKTLDTDNAVDGYIGDLLLGLDRIGRILFMYYWHNEKFKERYGQQDMVELEDNLRNVFKNLGELSLFLKQKTIEPDQTNNAEARLTEVLS
jgi:hypothetical protein